MRYCTLFLLLVVGSVGGAGAFAWLLSMLYFWGQGWRRHHSFHMPFWRTYATMLGRSLGAVCLSRAFLFCQLLVNNLRPLRRDWRPGFDADLFWERHPLLPLFGRISSPRLAVVHATLLFPFLFFGIAGSDSTLFPSSAGLAVSRHQNVLPLNSGGTPTPSPFPAAFVAPTASVLGSVSATPSVSVWYGATVRGDVAPVSLADRSAVMDGAIVGGGASVGAGAVVGAAAVVGDGAVLGEGAVVGAGAVLGEGVVVEANGKVDAGTFGGRDAGRWAVQDEGGKLGDCLPPSYATRAHPRGEVWSTVGDLPRWHLLILRLFVGPFSGGVQCDLPRPCGQASQTLLWSTISTAPTHTVQLADMPGCWRCDDS